MDVVVCILQHWSAVHRRCLAVARLYDAHLEHESLKALVDVRNALLAGQLHFGDGGYTAGVLRRLGLESVIGLESAEERARQEAPLQHIMIRKKRIIRRLSRQVAYGVPMRPTFTPTTTTGPTYSPYCRCAPINETKAIQDETTLTHAQMPNTSLHHQFSRWQTIDIKNNNNRNILLTI